MPSPGRQRGGSKSGGSKRGSAGGKVSRRGRLGVGWLRTSGTEEDLGKTNKELRAERKTYTDKSGPVRKATKAERAKMQRKLDKEAGKKTRKMVKSKKSDASKTAGETKAKRTGVYAGFRDRMRGIQGNPGLRGFTSGGTGSKR